MENGKENKSILYWLYQKCKNYRSQEGEKTDQADILDELSGMAGGMTPEASEERSDKADSDTADHPLPCQAAGGASKAAWPLSEDKRYLEPLLKMMAVLAETAEEGDPDITAEAEQPVQADADSLQAQQIRALESRLFAMVKKNTYYPDFCEETENFAKELAALAADFMTELTLKRQKRETAGSESEGTPQNTADSEGEDTPQKPADSEGEDTPQEPESDHSRSDAVVKLRCSHDRMYALAFVFPPFGGGKPADEDSVTAALEEAGIVYGVEKSAVAALTSGTHNMQLVLIARGSAAIDGKDGQVLEKYPRTEEIIIQQDEKGKADFKNLNSVQSVQENQVICEMLLPTAGEPGTDVCGHIIRQKQGVLPPVPAGKNTRFSEDGTRLVASACGHLLYRNACFEVTELLLIQGDVDYSVGNLDFPGDIVVRGEVRAGFTVKAAGTITIYGTVEGAALISGNDIILKKGMNGSYEGEIHAAGEVRANFLENCKIYASGSIYANSIISCKTYSGGSVHAEGSIATIMGGSVTALHSVTARIIGNKSLKETNIILGTAPWLIEERGSALKEQKMVLATLEKLDKNLNYLHRNKSSMTEDKLKVLAQLEEQQQIYQGKKKQLESRIEELDSYRMNFSQCRVKGNMIFPATRITIGPYVHIFETVALRCSAHVSGEQIVLGTM